MIHMPKTGKRIGGFRDVRIFNLFKDDCERYKADPVIWGNIVDRTHGNPCETGCSSFCDGGCPVYKRVVMKIHSKRIPAVTNKQLAVQLNTTPRQVAKMRRDGRIA